MKRKQLLTTLLLAGVFIGSLSAQTWTALPTDDTFSQASKNTIAQGDLDYLYLKNSTGGEWRRDVYMRFDLTACDVAFPAASVKIHLFTMPGDLSFDNPGFFCYKLNDAENSNWTEADLVSANRPVGFNFADRADSPDFIAYWDLTDYIDEAEMMYYELDLTTYANSQKAAGSNELNFIIRGMGTGGEELRIRSKEADEAFRPYVEVTGGGSGIAELQGEQIQVNIEDGYISLSAIESGAMVQFISVNGICQLQTVYEAPVYAGGLSGVYILRIQQNDTVVNKKVVL